MGGSFRRAGVAAVAAAVGLLAAGCLGSPDDCGSMATASCSGAFECSNGGLSGACDRATQVCVLKPGSVSCATVPGASESSCPSKAEALEAAGCGMPEEATCTGSSGSGITVECLY